MLLPIPALSIRHTVMRTQANKAQASNTECKASHLALGKLQLHDDSTRAHHLKDRALPWILLTESMWLLQPHQHAAAIYATSTRPGVYRIQMWSRHNAGITIHRLHVQIDTNVCIQLNSMMMVTRAEPFTSRSQPYNHSPNAGQ